MPRASFTVCVPEPPRGAEGLGYWLSGLGSNPRIGEQSVHPHSKPPRGTSFHLPPHYPSQEYGAVKEDMTDVDGAMKEDVTDLDVKEEVLRVS